MRHKNSALGRRHAAHNWEYADAATRESATGIVAADVNKLALQLDDYSLWVLIDESPVAWTQVNSESVTAVADDLDAEILRATTAEGNLTDAVNALAEGRSWKTAVRAATTANIALSGAQTIDGVSIVADDRVLVKDQTAPEENGIYVCVNPGAWTRTEDMDAATDFPSATVAANEGSTLADTKWTCTTDAPITVGTTAITWVQTGAAGVGDMVLASVQTVTGAKTFSDTKLILAGSTSGTTVIKAATAAGSTTVTLPAATDTLVGKATTDTLTNKTFDTAGAGNSLAVNGVAVTDNTGAGKVVRDASPALTGTPTAPTASAGTNTTQIATTAFVASAVAAGGGGGGTVDIRQVMLFN